MRPTTRLKTCRFGGNIRSKQEFIRNLDAKLPRKEQIGGNVKIRQDTCRCFVLEARRTLLGEERHPKGSLACYTIFFRGCSDSAFYRNSVTAVGPLHKTLLLHRSNQNAESITKSQYHRMLEVDENKGMALPVPI